MAFAGFRARCGSGCGCANGCALGTGDFSDGVTTGWTTSGTWAETGGLFVGTGAGIATFDTVVPLATDAVMVVTQPRKLSSDGTLRLAIAKVGSEYLFGELAISGGAATLRLGSFSGSATYLTDALVLNDVGTELDARSQLCVSWKPRGERQSAASGTTSTQYPGLVTDIAGGWTNDDNVKADDGSVATFIFPSSAGQEDSDALDCSDFDMSEVPDGASIDGIQVGVEATGGGGLFTVIDTTAILFGPNGVTSDNKAVGTVIGSPSVLGYGASNDNWNFTGTWADLKDPQFGIQIAFRRTTAFPGGSVTVDYVRMTVYWSTPDGRLGTLRASYRNTGDDQAYQCVTNYDVSWDAPDESKSGLVIDSGNWDFSTYSLEYLKLTPSDLIIQNFDINTAPVLIHGACNTCQCGGGDDAEAVEDYRDCGEFRFADCDSPPSNSYIADFGNGGWTDLYVPCGQTTCIDVRGPIVLDYDGNCTWRFIKIYGIFECPGASHLNSYREWSVLLSLDDEGGGLGRWRIAVNVRVDDASNSFQSSAYYESDTFNRSGCFDFPFAMTKTSEDHTFGTLPCTGALPATIDLFAA